MRPTSGVTSVRNGNPPFVLPNQIQTRDHLGRLVTYQRQRSDENFLSELIYHPSFQTAMAVAGLVLINVSTDKVPFPCDDLSSQLPLEQRVWQGQTCYQINPDDTALIGTSVVLVVLIYINFLRCCLTRMK